jgi:hypothetical protein
MITDPCDCGGCGAKPGKPHGSCCDYARCPDCGQELARCATHQDDPDRPPIWHGADQHRLIAVEMGWWLNHPEFGRTPDFRRIRLAISGGAFKWNTDTQTYDHVQ